MAHRREDNSRVRFLTEAEEKSLREVVQAKWAVHIPEFDLASGVTQNRPMRVT